MDETVIEICMYCRYGRLDVTAEWIQCDGCEGWVHTNCDPLFKPTEDLYFCENCILKNNHIPDIENRKANDDAGRKSSLIREFKFLPNGLIDDINYYRKTPCDRDYCVAIFNKLNYPIKELMASDFVLLTHTGIDGG